MSDDDILTEITAYLPALIRDGEVDARLLFNLCKEIQRRTLDVASRSAFAAANAISHGVDLREIVSKSGV